MVQKQTKNGKFWLFALGLAGLTFILSCLIFVFVLFKVTNRMSNTRGEKKSPMVAYKLTEINPQTNETTYGRVTLRKSLEQDQFLRYKSGDSIFVISHFETDEYECFGKCVCGDHDDDFIMRRSVNILSRGFFLAVAAVSTIMAVNIAKDVLLGTCYRFYREKKNTPCDEVAISVKVSTCEVKEKDSNSFDGFEKYSCEGYCVENPKVNRADLGKFQKNVICEDHSLAVTVFASSSFDVYSVKKKFVTEHLNRYCRKVGGFEYGRYYNHKQMKGVQYKANYFEWGNVCAPIIYNSRDMDNIKCTALE